MCIRDRRYSWHGVDHMYDGQIPFDEFYQLYLETLQAVDESVQQVLEWVEDNGLKENTMVVYMGDNGFLFGEHGLIAVSYTHLDVYKRQPYLCKQKTACNSMLCFGYLMMALVFAMNFQNNQSLTILSLMKNLHNLPLPATIKPFGFPATMKAMSLLIIQLTWWM